MATVTFYGGVGTVTGSRYLVEHNGTRVLVDCGLFQGLPELRQRNWDPPEFEPRSLDAVILTHAHIDHTGYLPRIVKLGYSGPVFTSRATADLLKILLPDSARLQEEEADYRNRHQLTRHNPALPLYNEDDARDAVKLFRTTANNGAPVDVAPGFRASFHVAGHIMGASLVLLEIDGAGESGGPLRFLFSGDLGHYHQIIIRDPASPPDCDYLMCESTYGDRLHPEEPAEVTLERVLNQAIKRGGPILIPAFAVGRTQEILYLIRELEDQRRIPVLPVIVDSPMASQATQVYNRWMDEHNADYASLLREKRHPLRPHSLMTASSRDESKRVNEMRGPRIIISASGMMTGGRVLHYAMRILPQHNATVIFVGYQAAGTTGRKLIDGDREVKIMKQMVPVNCHIERIDSFSAHADWEGVLKWLSGLKSVPRTVFMTHGEPEAAKSMASKIHERFGWTTKVPTLNETVSL